MRRLDSVHLQQIINTAEGEMGDNRSAAFSTRLALQRATSRSLHLHSMQALEQADRCEKHQVLCTLHILHPF